MQAPPASRETGERLGRLIGRADSFAKVEVRAYCSAMVRTAFLFAATFFASFALCQNGNSRVGRSPTAQDWTGPLQAEVKTLGKPSWRPMLAYEVDVHRASTHPPTDPFQYPWEDVGRGYGYGPGFGSWDLMHETIDVLPTAP